MNMYSDLTDAQLLRLSNNADHDAFKEIFNRYWAAILTIGYKITHDAPFVDDLLQELFIKLYMKKIDPKDDDFKLKAYLETALRNMITNYLIRNKRLETKIKNIGDVTYNFSHTPETVLIDTELGLLVSKEIKKLPPRVQEVIILKMSTNLTRKQIADQLGISEATVKGYLAEAREALRPIKNIILWLFFAQLLVLINKFFNFFS